MRLVKNSVQQYVQKPGIDGMYEMIRDNAAVCYQTDIEKMKLSPKDFVHQVLLANGHTRPLEFGTVYLKLPSAYKDMFCDGQPSDNFLSYSKFRYVARTGLVGHLSLQSNHAKRQSLSHESHAHYDSHHIPRH